VISHTTVKMKDEKEEKQNTLAERIKASSASIV
jgi:hypothetical protein